MIFLGNCLKTCADKIRRNNSALKLVGFYCITNKSKSFTRKIVKSATLRVPNGDLTLIV